MGSSSVSRLTGSATSMCGFCRGRCGPSAVCRFDAARSELQCLRPAHVEDKDLAVADAAGPGGAGDAVGDRVGLVVADPDADFHLGQKGQAVFTADVPVEVTFLTAVALGLLHAAREDVRAGDGAEHRLGAERLDD